MKQDDFIRAIQNERIVELVGPMLGDRHRPHAPTLYIDGGAQYRSLSDAFPSFHLGDGDSGEIIPDHLLPGEKDFSDFAYALNLIPAGVSEIKLFGFLGGRRDHEFINIGETLRFLSTRNNPTRVEFWGSKKIEVIGLSHGSWSHDIRGLFSLVSFNKNLVNLTGECKYKMDPAREMSQVSSLGLSNEGSGPVQIRCSAPVILFLQS